MTTARLLLIAACLAPLPVLAQDPNPLNGNWIARFNLPNGVSREARLEISGDKGTWQSRASNRNDPCVGKQMPVVVSDFDGQGFKLAILGSQALRGCPDTALDVKREGEQAWLGESPQGLKVLIARN
jgi:hypothetical protein